MLPLGALAKDTVTGYTGIIMARTEWLNGCWRIVLQSRNLHEGRPVDGQTFDAQNIQILDAAPADVQMRLPMAASAPAELTDASGEAPPRRAATGGPQRGESARF